MNGIDECAFEMSNGMGRSIKIAKKNKRQCEDNTIQTSEQTNNTSVD